MTSTNRPAAHYTLIEHAPAEAPWLMMVHGVSQNHRVFDRQVDAFKQQFRLVLMDLPGHGLSSDLPGPFGLSEYAGSLAAALQQIGIEHCHCWATHLGAGSSLVLACSHPQLFDSLVLESPVFPGHPLPSVTELLPQVAAVGRDAGIAAARELWWQQGGWFDVMRARPQECRADEQRALIDQFTGAPWLDSGLSAAPIDPIDTALQELLLPVLIYNGEHDLHDFVAVADQLQRHLVNCQRATIPEAGGFPLWEFPDRVNETVSQFIQQSLQKNAKKKTENT